MNSCRIRIVSCGLALLVLALANQRALVQDKTDAALDPAAKKLIGTFNYKVDGLVATCTITCEDGKWAVSAIFKEKGRNVGAYEGAEVAYKEGALTFQQKYLVKPRANWADNEKMTVKVVAGQLVGIPDSKDAKVRTFEPAGDAAPADPSAKSKDKEDAGIKKILGYWAGISNDGHRLFMHIQQLKDDKLSLTVNYYSKTGKLVGGSYATDFLSWEGGLNFTIRFLKKPSITYPDHAKRRVESLTDNTLAYSEPQGGGWRTLTTFTRTKK